MMLVVLYVGVALVFFGVWLLLIDKPCSPKCVRLGVALALVWPVGIPLAIGGYLKAKKRSP